MPFTVVEENVDLIVLEPDPDVVPPDSGLSLRFGCGINGCGRDCRARVFATESTNSMNMRLITEAQLGTTVAYSGAPANRRKRTRQHFQKKNGNNIRHTAQNNELGTSRYIDELLDHLFRVLFRVYG